MPDYPPDAGKGTLKRNAKAEKPSHPSHVGVCDVAGVRYRIAAWVKTDEKTSEKFFSLSFRELPDEQPSRPKQRPAGGPTFDEQIPFMMDR